MCTEWFSIGVPKETSSLPSTQLQQGCRKLKGKYLTPQNINYTGITSKAYLRLKLQNLMEKHREAAICWDDIFSPIPSTDSMQTQSEFLISYSYNTAKIVLKSNGEVRDTE